MGKKNKDKKHNSNPAFESKINDLREEQKKLTRKLKQLVVPCSHTNSNGKLKVEHLKGDMYRCTKCGCEFSFRSIPQDELEHAANVLHDALNQAKALSNDPEREISVINTLGQTDYNLMEFPELYDRITRKFGKNNGDHKKKKHKNKDVDFGSYGVGELSFGGNNRNKF